MNIEFKNVSFAYPGKENGALEDVNFQIKQGEFVLLVGESGCGKTTITRILNGLIPSFYGGNLKGNVLLDGKDIREYKSYELSSLVGSVFQNPRTQFFNADTDGEIVFGLENAGIQRDVIKAELDRVTSELHLEQLRNRNIFKLSGGEKQKIAFASVYATNPKIYLMDEPSANLDTQGIGEIKQCLEKIKREGGTVIVAEHRLYYLTSLIDRVIYLENGKIKQEIDGDTFRTMDLNTLNAMGLRTNKYELPCYEYKKCDYKQQETKCINDCLSLKGLSVELNKHKVLNSLNKDFYPNQIYCVVGNNGAGKSTLLRAICGLIKPSQGAISLYGKTVSGKERMQKSFIVMQDVNYQLFADSLLNECLIGAKEDSLALAEKTLDEMNLLQYKDCHPNTLSGGQKQRLAIAVSLMMDKEILLFDEPTSGLDYKNMRLCANILKKLANKGKIIIVVTHDEELISQCCDEIFKLENN
ncbi:ABC transporter ATP-binding protein [Lachnospira pectinoschiza]|uniref:Energy-coupling factor transport system ATP-binding protein n=1 Tax=Lachnospira pectinoschiza TaxID=28052 RepID=A0A1G9YV72_9FIRM|nr:energy-coupling factor ABC transporter ATP-binding protein [Lachnospira pectinoschiza]SDN12441.1 energy-coupling factor transport system ATP-binding protein [Lachnospira pectinoschiza]